MTEETEMLIERFDRALERLREPLPGFTPCDLSRASLREARLQAERGRSLAPEACARLLDEIETVLQETKATDLEDLVEVVRTLLEESERSLRLTERIEELERLARNR